MSHRIVPVELTNACQFALRWFEEAANAYTQEAAAHVMDRLRAAIASPPYVITDAAVERAMVAYIERWHSDSAVVNFSSSPRDLDAMRAALEAVIKGLESK